MEEKREQGEGEGSAVGYIAFGSLDSNMGNGGSNRAEHKRRKGENFNSNSQNILTITPLQPQE